MDKPLGIGVKLSMPMPNVKRCLLPEADGPSPGPTAFLTHVSITGSNHVDKIPLIGNRITIGRAFSNHVVFNSLQISRQHAILEYQKNVGKWFLQDKSTNGMKVNGIKCSKTEWFSLENEDIIYFLPPVVAYKINYTIPNNRPGLGLTACPRHIRMPRQDKSAQQQIQVTNSRAEDQIQGPPRPNSPVVIDILSSASSSSSSSVVSRSSARSGYESDGDDVVGIFPDQEMEAPEAAIAESNDTAAVEGEEPKLQKQVEGETDDLVNYYKQKCETLETDKATEKQRLDQIQSETDEFRQRIEEYQHKYKVLEAEKLIEKLELEIRLDQISAEKDDYLEKFKLYGQKCETLEAEKLNVKLELEKRLDQIKSEKVELRQKIDEYQLKCETLEAQVCEKLELEKRLQQISSENGEFRQKLDEYQEKCNALAAENSEKLNENYELVKQLTGVRSANVEYLEELRAYVEKCAALEQENQNENIELKKRLDRAKSEKDEFVQKLHELIEADFTCSICSDVFIEATVLGYCGHTFCNTCISSWFQKKLDCPICRKPISSKSTHIELKNFINRVYEIMPDEISAKRAKYVEERQVVDTKITAVQFENILQFQQLSNLNFNNLLVSVLGGNGELSLVGGQPQPAVEVTGRQNSPTLRPRPRRDRRAPGILRARPQGQGQAARVRASLVHEANNPIAIATANSAADPVPSPNEEAMAMVEEVINPAA